MSGDRMDWTGGNELLEALLKARSTPMPQAEPAPGTPLPRIRGKEIDGVLYVRADDVADAMATQAPKSCARLIAKLRRDR